MKIISGIYRNRKINYNIDSKINSRPFKNIIIQSIFNSIRNSIENTIILDLFSCSGQIAFNAISLNCKHVYMVENNKKNIEIICKNIQDLKIENSKYDVINQDCKIYVENTKLKFDYIISDPPFNTDYNYIILPFLLKNNVTKKTIIFMHFESKYFDNSKILNIIAEFKNLEYKVKSFGRSVLIKVYFNYNKTNE